jgi:hypothetical protein
MCVDASVVVSFVLMSLLYVVPFFFIHALAKNLEKYFRVRSKLFFIGAAFALISFVLLFIDSATNPASLELGSGVYLSYLNLAGAFFSALASFCFYTLTGSIKKSHEHAAEGNSLRDFLYGCVFYILLCPISNIDGTERSAVYVPQFCSLPRIIHDPLLLFP